MASRGTTRLLVVAIDFGTTYSGYAFSTKDKPLEIRTNQAWAAGSDKLISLKTPTCVLLNSSQEFVAFGYEAENKYADLAEDDKHHNWFLFRRFKMALCGNKELTEDLVIEDIARKKMPAITVFAHAISYMKTHFLKMLDNQTTGVEESDIQYVLTVPAIWNDKAKQFMRKAARKAGIPNSQLLIALEPEAASVWGQIVTDDLNAEGATYLVADIGGGTADFTAHKKMPDGSLQELCSASGGPWGGTMVDNAYLKFLSEIVGNESIVRLQEEEMSDYFYILREFETKKRGFSTDTDTKIVFRIPSCLRDMCEESGPNLKERIKRSRFNEKAVVSGDKIRVELSIVRGLFHESVQSVIAHMRKLFRQPALKETGLILLVGGFGECVLIQEAIRSAFPRKKLVVPNDAGLSVLKGAVRFGHMKEIVTVRKSKYTYGVDVNVRFDSKKHPFEKKVYKFGEERCPGVFQKIVSIGDDLYPGMLVTKSRLPMHADQTNAVIKIYCSEEEDPKFTTEPDCFYLGKIKAYLPDGETREDKRHILKIEFWDTEIRVRIEIVATGEEYETTVDCL